MLLVFHFEPFEGNERAVKDDGGGIDELPR